MRTKRLTPAGDRMLRDVRDHGNPTYSLHGMAAHGGAGKTQAMLMRSGAIRDKPVGMELTPVGREALKTGRLPIPEEE